MKRAWCGKSALFLVAVSFFLMGSQSAQLKAQNLEDLSIFNTPEAMAEAMKEMNWEILDWKVMRNGPHYALSHSEELFLLNAAHGLNPTGINRYVRSPQERLNRGPCVLVPAGGAAAEAAARNSRDGEYSAKPGPFKAEIVCGSAAILAMMPPTRYPTPPGGLVPDYVVPHKHLFPVNCSEEFWDCDDTAWAYCQLLPESERENCHIIFLFSYGWNHAFNIQRTRTPDGKWEVCLIEPSTGQAIHCWISENGELKIPETEEEAAHERLCRFYEGMGLVCSHWNNFWWRYRYLNPADGWSEWYCGEKPWWQCGNEEGVNAICQELRDAGIDPCQITTSCPGCGGTTPEPDPKPVPGRRRPGEY